MSALRNVPPLLGMVWDTSPALCVAVVILRIIAALIPVAMLYVSKLIIDLVVASISQHVIPGDRIWWLLATEAGLAILSDGIGRATALCDSLLGDRFTNHISLRMMAHASELDLVSFEDPVFYDKMERARRQTTGRLGMLASLAAMAQQLVTLLSLSVGILAFSPWLLLLLVAAIVPSFLGETRFAMLAYSLLYRWTPERRELDYLRMLGASNSSAKEVKIFGLGGHLTERARDLFDRFYNDNRGLAIRRAVTGGALNCCRRSGITPPTRTSFFALCPAHLRSGI
jgi:ATP-binding cassette subfamily B protein